MTQYEIGEIDLTAQATAAKTATDYIAFDPNTGLKIASLNPLTATRRVQIASDKISIYNDDSNYTYIDSNGLTVYKGGNDIANFSDIIRLGQQGNSRLEISSTNGLTIYKTGNDIANFSDIIRLGQQDNSRIEISSTNGLTIYKTRNDIANFSDTIRLGKQGNSRIELDYHSFRMFDKDNNSYVHLSDLRDQNGYANMEEYFVQEDSTNRDFELQFDVDVNNYFTKLEVKVNDTLYTVNQQYTIYSIGTNGNTRIQFTNSYIPAVGDIIKVTYRIKEKVYAYTFGQRESNTTIGIYSMVIGQGTASGAYSFSQGWNTIANGKYSHAEGYNIVASGNCSHAEGNNTTARGSYSHTEGYGTLTRGNFSHAEGWNTIAGYCSHAEGNNTIANNDYSHAEGYNTITIGRFSHAEGYNSRTGGYGLYAHAEGYNTFANEAYTHAEGNATTANGGGSHAEGGYTKASASYSHAEGLRTITNGYCSHAEGQNTIASSENSHAEGGKTTANGYCSHAEGYNTVASGANSHAEGVNTVANGSCSHVEGYNTIANGSYSHASGYYTIANASYQCVCGYYNRQTSALFVVGSGSNASSRKNALTVFSTSAYFNGTTSANGTAITSDIRVKENIKLLNKDESIQFINQLKPSSYIKNGDKKELGFIAQDIEKIKDYKDYLVTIDNSGEYDLKDYRLLNYQGLIAPTVAALQGALEKIKILENKIEILENKIEILENNKEYY